MTMTMSGNDTTAPFLSPSLVPPYSTTFDVIGGTGTLMGDPLHLFPSPEFSDVLTHLRVEVISNTSKRVGSYQNR